MGRLMSEMTTWLRSTITTDLEAARAADEAAPGPWVNTEQDGCGDAWQIHGAPTEESGTEWSEELRDVVPAPSAVATAAYEDGGGVWKREAADHIVLQQPRDTIARCEAELRVLALYEGDEQDRQGYGPDYWLALHLVVDEIASGYRHRPGFNPEWVEG